MYIVVNCEFLMLTEVLIDSDMLLIYSQKYVWEWLLVQKWSEEIDILAEIAATEPHVAFAAFTHGVSARWQYFFHVIDISSNNNQ